MAEREQVARRVALVTGARGSLGSVLVERLLDRGWTVAAVDRSQPQSPDADGCRSWVSDLAAEGVIEAVIAEVCSAFGSLDLVVNAVGWIHSEPTLRFAQGRLVPHPRETWLKALEANLTIPFLVAASAAAVMARQRTRGSIVQISSVSARGNGGQVAYAAAKAGLEAATKAMARELGPLGIRVNAVAPGFIDTASTRAALTPEQVEEIVASTPLRRLGTAADVADAVELCWTNAFLHGAVIAIDGGIVI